MNSNVDEQNNFDAVDTTSNEIINDEKNIESIDTSMDTTGADMLKENTDGLISTMPIADENMGYDDLAIGGETQDGSKGLSNTAILSIVIGACVVVGVVLGIIFGKRAANK